MREGNSNAVLAARLEQQVDFINALYAPESNRSFAIRFISIPDGRSITAGKVELVLFGKVSAPAGAQATEGARSLCAEVLCLLGGAMSEQSWVPVSEPERFRSLWQPFAQNRLHVAEIARRVDQVRLSTLRPRPSLGSGRASAHLPAPGADCVFYVHPFVPRASSFSRLLRMLLLQPSPVIFQAALTPVSFTPEESEGLAGAVNQCEHYRQQVDALAHEPLGLPPSVQRLRAQALAESLLEQWLRLRDAPFLLQVLLASPEAIPRSLAEAIGIEITAPIAGSSNVKSGGPAREFQCGGYDVLYPETPAQRQSAIDNLCNLEVAPWIPTFAPKSLLRLRQMMDASEAVGAFRFPLAMPEGLLGAEVRAARSRPLPRELAELARETHTERLLLGENHFLGCSQPAVLAEKERLQHTYIIGQTGTGKTTLLKTMIVSDMRAGKGLAVLDPHGDLHHELLALVPPERRADVVVVDPTDGVCPVGLNLLECAIEEERHFVVREMRAILQTLLNDQFGAQASEWTGPVFYQHMQMNMLLAMSRPDDPGALLEFHEIFRQENYWKRWLPLQWDEPMLKRWVEKNLPEADYKSRAKGEISMGEYLSTKFDDFLFDPKLRLIFGQKRSTFDLRQIIDEGKILLVNLAKGELAEPNSRFLGMLLLAKIQAAAMSRVELPAAQRRPFYLYVDEFQALATESFVTLLSEARKFGLGLVLSNQFLSQIHDERINQSIFGNVGTSVCFRVGREDAELLQRQFAPYFDAEDLANLPNWEACLKTKVRGQVVAPFTLRTGLPLVATDSRGAKQVIALSRKKYGRPRKFVLEGIRRSMEPPPLPKSPPVESQIRRFRE
ncbi:MAG: type IV secretion system DNA-binding domain-containing protein [Verrucomicrobiota bacterium]